MVEHLPIGSPIFNRVAKGLVALHRQIKEGRDDSSEADSVRDTLDGPLKALSRTEKERAQWLSEDLYSVSEPTSPASLKAMNPQAQQQLNEAFEACQNREWDRALALLRRRREYISPELLSYLRGSIWLKAGIPEVAAVFFGHASESDPANANYQAIYMHALTESNPDAASALAQQVLADFENYPPVVVARAADIRFNETRITRDAESAQMYLELIPILERNMTRIENDEGTASRESAYAMTLGLLGFCYEFLGNVASAVQYYSRGLQVNPNNDGLLVARGILQYGTSPRAITDLDQAVKLGSPVVWPYLFLAHHDLTSNRLQHCREMCETGLRMRGSDTAKSQLEEWRAIAQAELGFPPESVRAAFEAALRLDPSNDLARQNHDAYEASLRVTSTRPDTNWEKRSEAAIRQFGVAEHRLPLAAA